VYDAITEIRCAIQAPNLTLNFTISRKLLCCRY
jgi:hypothetical protein